MQTPSELVIPDITSAHISGSLGQALAIVDGHTWLYENNTRRPPKSNEVKFFFDHGLEIATFDPGEFPVTEEVLLGRLGLEQLRFKTLHNLLIGMDAEILPAHRTLCIKLSDRLMNTEDIFTFVEERFFESNPSDVWDVPGALELCDSIDAPNCRRIYSILNYPALFHIEDEIISWSKAQGMSNFEAEGLIGEAKDSGLTRHLRRNVVNGNGAELRSVPFHGNFSAPVRKLAVHLVNSLSQNATYMESKPASIDVHDYEPIDSATATIEKIRDLIVGESLPSRSKAKPKLSRRLSAEEKRDLALRNVNWIAEQFSTGRADRAWRDLESLVRNDLSENNVENLVKSLSNIATHPNISEDNALALAGLAVEIAPEDLRARTAQANLLKLSGRLEEALAAYEDALAAFPGDEFVLMGRADVLHLMGRFDDAIIAYRDAVNLLPGNITVRNGYAETLKSADRPEDALAVYEDNLKIDPADVYAHTGRAGALRAVARFDEALVEYEETARQFDDNVVVWNGRAATIREVGRLGEAVVAYEAIISKFPNDASAYNGRAQVIREMGLLDEAIAAFEQTRDMFPRDPVTACGLAETLKAAGRFGEALSEFDKIVARFPRNSFALAGRAETLRAMDRLDDALAAYDQAIAECPHHSILRCGRAEILRVMGDLPASVQAYDQIILRHPRVPAARNGRGQVLKSMGHLNEALFAFEQSIKLSPHTGYAWAGRAETLRAMGRAQEAVSAYEEMIARFPRAIVARMGLADTLREIGQLKDAIDLLRVARTEFPYSQRALVTLALALFDAGHTGEARTLLKEIPEIPKSQDDWVGAHILCVASMREGITDELIERVRKLSQVCPFKDSKLYFYATLAALNLAKQRPAEALAEIGQLASRRGLDVTDEATLKMMKAHAQAVTGDLAAAKQTLSDASNLVPYEIFQQRLRGKLERRFGIGAAQRERTDQKSLDNSDVELATMEIFYWVSQGARRAA